MRGKMRYLADTIAWLHALWALAALLAIPLLLYSDAWKPFYLLFIIGTFLSWLIYGACMFRVLEQRLRSAYDPKNMYTRTFTGHYLKKVFRIGVSDTAIRFVGYVLTGGILLLIVI